MCAKILCVNKAIAQTIMLNLKANVIKHYFKEKLNEVIILTNVARGRF